MDGLPWLLFCARHTVHLQIGTAALAETRLLLYFARTAGSRAILLHWGQIMLQAQTQLFGVYRLGAVGDNTPVSAFANFHRLDLFAFLHRSISKLRKRPISRHLEF